MSKDDKTEIGDDSRILLAKQLEQIRSDCTVWVPRLTEEEIKEHTKRKPKFRKIGPRFYELDSAGDDEDDDDEIILEKPATKRFHTISLIDSDENEEIPTICAESNPTSILSIESVSVSSETSPETIRTSDVVPPVNTETVENNDDIESTSASNFEVPTIQNEASHCAAINLNKDAPGDDSTLETAVDLSKTIALQNNETSVIRSSSEKSVITTASSSNRSNSPDLRRLKLGGLVITKYIPKCTEKGQTSSENSNVTVTIDEISDKQRLSDLSMPSLEPLADVAESSIQHIIPSTEVLKTAESSLPSKIRVLSNEQLGITNVAGKNNLLKEVVEGKTINTAVDAVFTKVVNQNQNNENIARIAAQLKIMHQNKTKHETKARNFQRQMQSGRSSAIHQIEFETNLNSYQDGVNRHTEHIVQCLDACFERMDLSVLINAIFSSFSEVMGTASTKKMNINIFTELFGSVVYNEYYRRSNIAKKISADKLLCVLKEIFQGMESAPRGRKRTAANIAVATQPPEVPPKINRVPDMNCHLVSSDERSVMVAKPSVINVLSQNINTVRPPVCNRNFQNPNTIRPPFGDPNMRNIAVGGIPGFNSSTTMVRNSIPIPRVPNSNMMGELITSMLNEPPKTQSLPLPLIQDGINFAIRQIGATNSSSSSCYTANRGNSQFLPSNYATPLRHHPPSYQQHLSRQEMNYHDAPNRSTELIHQRMVNTSGGIVRPPMLSCPSSVIHPAVSSSNYNFQSFNTIRSSSLSSLPALLHQPASNRISPPVRSNSPIRTPAPAHSSQFVYPSVPPRSTYPNYPPSSFHSIPNSSYNATMGSQLHMPNVNMNPMLHSHYSHHLQFPRNMAPSMNSILQQNQPQKDYPIRRGNIMETNGNYLSGLKKTCMSSHANPNVPSVPPPSTLMSHLTNNMTTIAQSQYVSTPMNEPPCNLCEVRNESSQNLSSTSTQSPFPIPGSTSAFNGDKPLSVQVVNSSLSPSAGSSPSLALSSNEMPISVPIVQSSSSPGIDQICDFDGLENINTPFLKDSEFEELLKGNDLNVHMEDEYSESNTSGIPK